MQKPDARQLSDKTGYLYKLYLEMKRMTEQMQPVCKQMEQLEPWFDSEHRKK